MELLAFLLPFIFLVNWGLNFIEKQNKKQKEIDKLNQPNKKNTMNNLNQEVQTIDKITSILTNKNINYWVSQDKKSIRVGFTLDQNQTFDILIYLSDNYIEFNCPVLLNVTDDKLSMAAEIVTRLNQFYNLGSLKLYYENRSIVFQNIFVLFENEITENKFMMYFDFTLEGARDCRPLVSKVVLENEEPVIAMMGLGNNS